MGLGTSSSSGTPWSASVSGLRSSVDPRRWAPPARKLKSSVNKNTKCITDIRRRAGRFDAHHYRSTGRAARGNTGRGMIVRTGLAGRGEVLKDIKAA